MLAQVLAVIVCPTVCVCVCVCHTPVLAKRRITQATPRDSPGTSFSDANSRW